MERVEKEALERKANAVISESQIESYPVDVIQIANDNGFKVYEQYLPPDISGMIMVNDEAPIKNFDSNKVIIVNQYDPPLRRRFTIAHELAHYFLHKSELIPLYAHRDEGNLSQNETEANIFASNLLMPKAMVLQAVKDIWEDSSGDVADSILEGQISQRFKVSLSEAKARLFQLKLLC